MTTDFNRNPRARLIVLLPESMAGDGEFAQRVHWMAVKDDKDVVYLTLQGDPENYLTVSRGLATMKAVTEANQIRAISIQVSTEKWFGKLNEIVRPNDVVVCQAEQLVRQGFAKSIALSEYLAKTTSLHVITMDGYYHPQQVAIAGWLRAMVFWIGAALILAGFTYIEVETGTFIPGFASKLVLLILLGFEFGAVWAWSRINH